MKKVLIVVDVQYDFCPVSDKDLKEGLGGALAVPGGNEVIPVINSLFPKFDLVIFTKDWHTTDMDAFASSHDGAKPFEKYINTDGVEDVLWPAHCVADTRGADLHDGLDLSLIKGDMYIFKKGITKFDHPYSGFGAEDMLNLLQSKGVTETFVTGLALDYCVLDTALDSKKNDFKTTVVLDATRAITENGKLSAISKLELNEINTLNSDLI